MKKFTIILIIVTGSFISYRGNAQTWAALDTGLWAPSPPVTTTVISLGTYNSMLFAGGYFTNADGIPVKGLVAWDGTNWINIGATAQSSAFCTYNGVLFIAGGMDSIGGKPVNGITQWNGSSWDTVGGGVNGFISAMAVYNGNLYVGGHFTLAGGVAANNIAMWNGTKWSAVGNGITGKKQFVYSLCVYNGNLYTGGQFDSAGGSPAYSLASWNGSSWLSMGWKMQVPHPKVDAMCVSNSKLYVGGFFDSAGAVCRARNIAEWNDTNWSVLGTGVDNFVEALASNNGIVYAAGEFDSAGGQAERFIAGWNGIAWSSLGTGMSSGTTEVGLVHALTIYSGNLYAGGQFDSAGGKLVNYIAEWKTPASILELRDNNSVKVCPNPSAGLFTLSLSYATEKCNVEIFNVMGQKVNFGMLKQVQHDYTLDLSSQPNGIYFYRVLKEDGSLVGEGKMIIEK